MDNTFERNAILNKNFEDLRTHFEGNIYFEDMNSIGSGDSRINFGEKYTNEIDFFESLCCVTPCNLRDDNTSIEKAVVFCRDILRHFDKASCLALPPNLELLSRILRRLGVCSSDEVASHLKGNKGELAINERLNIDFPLSLFERIMKSSQSGSISSYTNTWSLALRGGELSYVNKWLKSNYFINSQTNNKKVDEELPLL